MNYDAIGIIITTMEKNSFVGIISRYASISHEPIRSGKLIVSNISGVYWVISIDSKVFSIRKGTTNLVYSMPYANINRCWLEYRAIPYLVIRTGYPMRKIYVPFPGIRPEDRDYILVSPPTEKKEKKRPERQYDNSIAILVRNKPVIIYTDGSCHRMDKNGTGIGGWAYSITVDGKEIVCGARIENLVSNGDMEIKAAAMGLRRLFGCSPEYIIVMSDYQDVCRFGKKIFKPKPSDPRKGAFDILRDAISTIHCPLSWMWVKGHKGNRYNALCDKRLRLLLKKHIAKTIV